MADFGIESESAQGLIDVADVFRLVVGRSSRLRVLRERGVRRASLA